MFSSSWYYYIFDKLGSSRKKIRKSLIIVVPSEARGLTEKKTYRMPSVDADRMIKLEGFRDRTDASDT